LEDNSKTFAFEASVSAFLRKSLFNNIIAAPLKAAFPSTLTFVVSSFGESSVKLIKNANAPYEVSASGVTLYLPKATREHVALLEKGDIDAADLSFEKMELIKNSPDFTFSESSDCVWALIFNESDALWQNENLRNAVLTCSDRTVFETQSEHISPANRLFSKSTRIFSKNYLSLTKNVSTPKFNTETAKTLYAAALLELEMAKIYNTTVLVADSQIYKDSFSALNQVFQRELSLYFSPQYLAEGELIKRVKSGDFSAAVIPLYITGDTPFSILEYFYKSSAVCILPIENEDFINSFTLAQGISDASGAKHYGEAEAALYKSGIVNPLFFENSYFVTSNSVSGFLKDQYGSVLFKNVVKK